MCGERFRLAYIEGKRVRPGIAAAVGSAVHAVAAKNLIRKMEGGGLMPLDEVRDEARDAFERQVAEGIELLPDELDAGAAKVQGAAADKARRLSVLHARVLAPVIRPSHVERAWVLELDGFNFDLAGEIDVQEARTETEPSSIRDLKTSGKTPSETQVASSIQLTVYTLAGETFDGERPDRVMLDHCIGQKSGDSVATYVSERKPEHIAAFWRRLERMAEVIDKQVFTPSRPHSDWWCTTKWCGYARTNPDTGRPYCDFFSVARVFSAPSLSTNNQPGGISGNRKPTRKIESSADRAALIAGLP